MTPRAGRRARGRLDEREQDAPRAPRRADGPKLKRRRAPATAAARWLATAAAAAAVSAMAVLALERGAVRPARASQGDRQYEYQRCVHLCAAGESDGQPCGRPPARVLGVVPWSCQDECQYQCMHEVEASRAAAGQRPLQYHGKWPFRRWWGVQEPLSALFSLWNAVPNAYYAAQMQRFVLASDGVTARLTAKAAVWVAILTWTSSLLFHCKETLLTERLDYHFSTLHICMSLQVAVTRLVGLLGWPPQLLWGLLAAQALFVVRHVWYMNTVLFDYGYNTKVMGVLIASQALVWLAWYVLASREGGGARHASMIMWFQLGLALSASLELADFPPLFEALDAHAAWHLATAPLAVWWYWFAIEDAKWRKRRRVGSV